MKKNDNFYLKCIEQEVYGNAKLNVLQRYKIRTFNPSLNAVYLLRKFQLYSSRSGFVNNFLAKNYYRCLFSRYNIYLRKTTKIGIGLRLPHPAGIVFGEWTSIGEDAWVYQHVTFGSVKSESTLEGNQPLVGNGCRFYAGACVIGGIHVADKTTVGCNSILSVDTEPNSTYVGINRRIE